MLDCLMVLVCKRSFKVCLIISFVFNSCCDVLTIDSALVHFAVQYVVYD